MSKTSRLLILAVAVLIALPSAAAAMHRNPYAPDTPYVPPEELERQRQEQQKSAPIIEQPDLPTPAPPPAYDYSQDQNASPADLVAALETHQRSKAEAGNAAAPRSQEEQESRRRRGLVLIVASAAGIAGLGLSRAAMTYLSRTSPREAQQALEEGKDIRENARSYGGDHKEYFID